MTIDEILHRAKLNRDCGLPKDAAMIDALADVYEAAKGLESVVGDQDLRRVRNSVSIAIARVEALQP